MELSILIAGFLLILALGILILWKLRAPRDGGLSEEIKGALSEQKEKVGEVLQSQTADLAERIAKSSGDLRQEVSDRLAQALKKVEEELRKVGTVGDSIIEVNKILRAPHLRGGFGEATLERLLSDFLPSHMYELQAGVQGGGRVDAVVKFPQARLPIDSKFPREQVLALFEEGDPEKLAEARKTFGQVLKREADRISKYIGPEAGVTDMALMFLPSETLYFEAIRDGRLWEDLSKKRVFPVSPNTLAIALHGIAVAHKYYEMAKGVEKTIEEVRKAQRHFELFQDRFEEVGKGLEKAQEAFNTAHGHLGRYSGAVGRLTGERPEELPAPEESLLPFRKEPGEV